MSIEKNIERIANAVEALVALAQPGRFVATQEPTEAPKSYVETRIAEAQASESPKRGRGRPPKTTAVVVEVERQPVAVVEEREEPETDSVANFLDEPSDAEPEAAEATIEDVRQALSDLVTRKGGGPEARDLAFAILQKAGDASMLPGSPKAKGLGENAPGMLKQSKYQAVVDAAKAQK